MRSLNLFLLIVALGIPSSLQAKVRYGSESSIYTVNPGYLVANKINTVILTGKNLSGARSCVLIPVLGDSGNGSGDPVFCDSTAAVPGTEQLLTQINLKSHPDDANYILLLLTTGPDCTSNPPKTSGTPPAGQTNGQQPPQNGNPPPPVENTGTGQTPPTDNATRADGKTCPASQGAKFQKLLREHPDRVIAYTVIHARGAVISPANPAQPNPGNQPGQASPFATCLNGNVDPNSQINPPGISGPAVNCASSLLTDGEVKDNFGGHVNHTYFALQVRISNQNANNDFLLRDILLRLPDGRIVSSRVRRFAQGVALKGKSLDIRAGFYNSFQAAGSLYGALSVFASPGFQAAGNAIQGSFLAGFAQIFPDYTTENVNRFNNAVFDDQSPSIVPKDSIGQPPLYVVALVPKPPELKGEGLRYYERSVAVSIEGTFIKQVSLVTLSNPVLDFGSEYISPDYAFQYLEDSKDTNGLQLLRDAAKANELEETIMNNNSTPMNITGLKFITNSPSSTLSKSPDFDFDLKKTDCGRVAGNTDKDFNPKMLFTVPAHGSCTLWLYFHPNGLADANATVQLLGDNLDGPTTFNLKGKAVGLLVDSKDIKPNPTVVACSYAAKTPCNIDLGKVPGTNATIPIFVINNDTTPIVTPKQDGQQTKDPNGKPATCKPHPESDFAKPGAAACLIALTLDPAKGSTSLALSNAAGNIATFVVSYQTKADDITFDAQTPTPQGSNVIISGSVNDRSNPAVHVSDGTVTASDNGKILASGVPVGVGGKFSIDVGAGLGPGTHQIQVSYIPGENSVYQASNKTAQVEITEPPQPTFEDVTAGTAVSVTLTMKTHGGVACNGKATVTDQGGAHPVPGDVANGSVKLNMAVQKGEQKKTVTFTPTDTTCAQLPSTDVSITGK